MKRVMLTRTLTDAQRAYAQQLGLQLLESPALHYQAKYQPFDLAGLLVRAGATPWVFTSAHATQAVAQVAALFPPNFKVPVCYCVGAVTAQPLLDLGWSVRLPIEATGTALADCIAQDDLLAVHHFCGRDRRSELREGLSAAHISLEETVLYEMVASPFTDLPADIGAIACLSPRAVAQLPDSLPPHMVLFAIGRTTAQAFTQRYPQHTVHVAQAATVQSLLLSIAQNQPCTCP